VKRDEKLWQHVAREQARAALLSVQLKMLEERARRLCEITESVFEIASPGPVKNSLWSRYRSLVEKGPT